MKICPIAKNLAKIYPKFGQMINKPPRVTQRRLEFCPKRGNFAKLDENNFVSMVAEKNPISNLATVGYYFWKKEPEIE